VAPARRLFAHPLGGDPAIASGPSGCAGLAASLRACADTSAVEALNSTGARAFCWINSEGQLGDNRHESPRCEDQPHLLQHAQKSRALVGVGEAALAEARRANRPILLSVGYAACHWFHVMAHESFESPEVGGGDERAVRQPQGRPRGASRRRRIYMQSAQYSRGSRAVGRSPMFCTPDGEPFWGGTYFPHPARYEAA